MPLASNLYTSVHPYFSLMSILSEQNKIRFNKDLICMRILYKLQELANANRINLLYLAILLLKANYFRNICN